MKQLSIAVLLLFLWIEPAFAHKEDYLDETFVYETIKQGVASIEYRTKYVAQDLSDRGDNFWVNSPFMEYGLTNHTMVEGRLSVGNGESNDTFSGGFIQIRHRFGEEGKFPIDPAIALEYEAEKETTKTDHFINPILTLSKDIGDLNGTANLIFKTGLGDARDFEFEYALGLRYPRTGVRYGVEFKDLGDDDRFILPQISFPVTRGLSAKLGIGTGVTSESPDFLAEVLIEWEFGEEDEHE